MVSILDGPIRTNPFAEVRMIRANRLRVPELHPLVWLGGRFGYFYFFLLGEGERESEARGGGGGIGFILKISGGGCPQDERG